MKKVSKKVFDEATLQKLKEDATDIAKKMMEMNVGNIIEEMAEIDRKGQQESVEKMVHNNYFTAKNALAHIILYCLTANATNVLNQALLASFLRSFQRIIQYELLKNNVLDEQELEESLIAINKELSASIDLKGINEIVNKVDSIPSSIN